VTGDRSVPDMVDRCIGGRWIVAAVARVEVINSLRYPHVACHVYIYSTHIRYAVVGVSVHSLCPADYALYTLYILPQQPSNDHGRVFIRSYRYVFNSTSATELGGYFTSAKAPSDPADNQARTMSY
jgi:hypothetical protein